MGTQLLIIASCLLAVIAMAMEAVKPHYSTSQDEYVQLKTSIEQAIKDGKEIFETDADYQKRVKPFVLETPVAQNLDKVELHYLGQYDANVGQLSIKPFERSPIDGRSAIISPAFEYQYWIIELSRMGLLITIAESPNTKALNSEATVMAKIPAQVMKESIKDLVWRITVLPQSSKKVDTSECVVVQRPACYVSVPAVPQKYEVFNKKTGQLVANAELLLEPLKPASQ